MDTETNLGKLLGQSSRLMSNALDIELRGLGITAQQWSLLAELMHKGGRNQTELAAALLKTKASVGSLIDYLEQKSCIIRVASPRDRRETIIEITATGRTLFKQALPLAGQVISRATGAIQPEDMATTQKTLQQIILNFEDPQ